ncbi:hypothetical protein [Aeromonas phage AS-yj]|uniref:Uncharacterized protein n=2 Tax=Ceceduovirus aszj TaxID=2843652 RepID=A0A223LD75_9CAUD|nr:hypothetical protein HWB28_gp152 [Aeromonas phage AS-zj]ASU00400.1 hypothetical protein [Aeromonas phage AS-zj]ATI17911.1 hypothetical protein [Aeromonas phage AS-yj]
MKLTNIMPGEGYCIAVWSNGEGHIESEKWRINLDDIEYWDDLDGWCVVDLNNEFYSKLEIQWVVPE